MRWRDGLHWIVGCGCLLVLFLSPAAGAVARDAGGQTSGWTASQTVAVTGGPLATFLTSPYRQNVRTNGITLMWELDAAVAVEVEYGLAGGPFQRQSCAPEPTGAGTAVYRCVLNGLEPGRAYQFKTWTGAREGPGGTFKTAPAQAVDFSFGVWADSQGSNHGAYAADPLEPTKSMMRHLAASGVDLAITAGDLAENGSSYPDTRQYYLDRVAGLLGPTVPWFVAWGNHDGGPESIIRKFADLPSKERSGFTPGYGSYSFDYAGCHFVCLDYLSQWDDIPDWLVGDLQSAANRDARFTFLFIHVPPYCELWIDGDSFLRETLVPLMETYGVDACFSGHTHEYSRGFLNGVFYCVTGGGSWLDTPEVLVYDWDHMTVGGHHAIPGITKPGPDRGGGLINEYVRVEVRGDSFTASMLGFAPDGTPRGVFDTFSKGAATSHPPAQPQLTGPAVLDLSAGAPLVLSSSAFSDPDLTDAHQSSLWRLTRTAEAEAVGGVLVQGTTGPNVLSWSAPLTNLWPGQTVYATVQHAASDGGLSPWATPIALRLEPDRILMEDFESTAEFALPAGWMATHHTAIDENLWDPENPRSNTYLTWTVVSAERLARVLGANRVNVASVVQGNSLYAESDHRSGAQLQYLLTPEFELSGWTNVLLLFRSNYMQNQDNLAALEYTTDAGASWKPVVFLLDGPDVMRVAGTQTIDALATFTRVDPDGVPKAGGASPTGGTYGEHVLSRPFDNLGDFISPRVNDDAVESKRLERFRLPGADGQNRVRFRFAFVGTASWFWGIDDFSLFGNRHPEEPLEIVGATLKPDGLELKWTGPAGPYQLQGRPALTGSDWTDWGAVIGAAERSVTVPVEGLVGFFRLELAR